MCAICFYILQFIYKNLPKSENTLGPWLLSTDRTGKIQRPRHKYGLANSDEFCIARWAWVFEAQGGRYILDVKYPLKSSCIEYLGPKEERI
jgi:hypothetical protein